MENLTKYRKEKGISQRELGRRIGLSGQYIAKLEKDEGANPTKETLQKIADELGISIGQLLEIEKFGEDMTRANIYDFLNAIGYIITDCNNDETHPILQIKKGSLSTKKDVLSAKFESDDIINFENDILSYIEYLIYRQSRKDN